MVFFYIYTRRAYSESNNRLITVFIVICNFFYSFINERVGRGDETFLNVLCETEWVSGCLEGVGIKKTNGRNKSFLSTF